MQKRLITCTFAAFVALLIGISFFFAPPGSKFANGGGLRNLASMFALRSPGERPHGALFSTKPEPIRKARRVIERQDPIETVAIASQLLEPLALDVDELVLVPPIFPGVDNPPDSPEKPLLPPPPNCCVIELTTLDPPPSSPPTMPVPEPSTWMMMVVGFFGVGFTLRRRLYVESGTSCRSVSE